MNTTPNRYESGDSSFHAGGTTHSRIFGGDKGDFQDGSAIINSPNITATLNQSRNESNTSSKSQEHSEETAASRNGQSDNANFPLENTHCRIFGSVKAKQETCDGKDNADKWRRPTTQILSKGVTDETRADQEGDELNNDDSQQDKVKPEDAKLSKDAAQKGKSGLRSKIKETLGKVRNNPTEGTHNRIFGSFSMHDKEPWVSSPAVNSKQKPFQLLPKTTSNQLKGRKLFQPKSEDTHTRIFGKVTSNSRNVVLAPPIYPKLPEEDTKNTQSRIFGSVQHSQKEPLKTTPKINKPEAEKSPQQDSIIPYSDSVGEPTSSEEKK